MSSPDGVDGLLVLAVDDEAPGLDELAYELEAHPEIKRVLKASESVDALRIVHGTDPEVAHRRESKQPPVDAVFADINMPGLSGIELAKVINSMNPAPKLVFVTGIAEEAVTAFELGALDYLLKPVTQDRLDRAIKRIYSARASAPPVPQDTATAATPVNSDDEVIAVELGGSTKLIARSSVRWVEAQGDYARLHTQEGSHLVRIPLAQLEERWRGAGFVRIHRSYLVALPLVTELKMTSSGYTVIVGDNEKELPVSRRHTRDLKDRLVPSARSSWRNGG
jgi:two-component system response regulator LytT